MMTNCDQDDYDDLVTIFCSDGRFSCDTTLLSDETLSEIVEEIKRSDGL